MKKPFTKPIVIVCAILWVLSVLFLWLQAAHGMDLLAKKAASSAYFIFWAFIFSFTVNLILNPFLWIIAVCFTRQAKQSDPPYRSKWRFYQRAVAVILVIAFFAAGYGYFLSQKKSWNKITLPKKYFPENKTMSFKRSVPDQEGALVISGIMVSSDPAAVVDGKIVKSGDSVGGYKVLAIEKDAVKFQSPDGQVIRKKMP